MDGGIGMGWDKTYCVNMLETISISASAAAIFSAEEGCGREPKPRKDIVAAVFGGIGLGRFGLGRSVAAVGQARDGVMGVAVRCSIIHGMAGCRCSCGGVFRERRSLLLAPSTESTFVKLGPGGLPLPMMLRETTSTSPLVDCTFPPFAQPPSRYALQ